MVTGHTLGRLPGGEREKPVGLSRATGRLPGSLGSEAWMCVCLVSETEFLLVCLLPVRGQKLSHNIWTDDDMGGAEGILRSWEGSSKGFSPYASYSGLGDQANPGIKSGPAFQVPSVPGSG